MVGALHHNCEEKVWWGGLHQLLGESVVGALHYSCEKLWWGLTPVVRRKCGRGLTLQL